jgi:glycosyltransferase involved in cell wall biosynthesis
LGLSSDQALIVTASRLAPQKAVHVMLHALALLSTPSVLAVLGVGPLEEELRALVAWLRLEDRIRWLGFRDDIADHLAAADVFCLSSVWEGVPLAAMEAIQLGTPVVATAVGGMPELIVDRHSGRLVEPGVPRAIADALHEVLTDDDVRKTYVENARVDLETNFSTERMIARLREVYVGSARA